MAGRVLQVLTAGCALLLGTTLSACTTSPYTQAADPRTNTRFQVPGRWHQIGQSALASELKAELGNSLAGAWAVAYQAGPQPAAADFLSFDLTQPFVFAEAGQLSTAAHRNMSDDTLRDFFLPVTATARHNEPSDFPLTGFRQIRDRILNPGNGVHGVWEIYDYTVKGGQTDTWDQIALTNASHTYSYFIVIHCTAGCYRAYQAQINGVMLSFRTGFVIGPFIR